MTQETASLEFLPAAKTSDVPAGQAIRVEVGGMAIALFNLDGTFYATEEICTHAQASLVDGFISGDEVECPLHGACFSIKTGEALTAPACIDLAIYPVRVENDEILIGVPGER